MERGLVRRSGRRHFELFDGLRAGAALLVLALHVCAPLGMLAPGFPGDVARRFTLGVAIFFAISGFLLYRPFVAARRDAQRGIGDMGAYAARRAARIIPAYWLALTVLALWPGLTGVFTGDFWVYYGFLQIHGIVPANSGLSVAWSLCVEVLFYLTLPLYALAMVRAYRRWGTLRAELLGLGGIVVISLSAHAVLAATDYRWNEHALLLIGRAHWFVPGMALAVASVYLPDLRRTPWAVALVERRPWVPWAIAAALFGMLATVAGEAPYTTPAGAVVETTLAAAMCFMLLLPAVFGEHAGGWPRRLLATPVVAWLGLVSYGIYLWHEPLASRIAEATGTWVLALPLTIAAAAACAAVSWYALEQPVLRAVRRRLRRRGEPAEPAHAEDKVRGAAVPDAALP